MTLTNAVRVRLGEPADEDAVVEAMREMHALGGTGFVDAHGKPLPFSEAKVRNAVRMALVRHESWVGLIDVDGRIAGAILLTLTSPFYSDAAFLADRTMFVLPAYRGGSHMKLLLEFAVTLACALGVPFACSVVGERSQAKVRLMSRLLGQAPVGGVFYVSNPALNGLLAG